MIPTGFEDDTVVVEKIHEIHAGPCPRCNGTGPIDLHQVSWAWSLIAFTRFNTDTILACPRCAADEQRAAIGRTLLFGWWGVPFGLILTPVQVWRNAQRLASPPDTSVPSLRLRALAVAVIEREARLRASLRCPHCEAPYLLSDYRDDAPRIFCQRCNGEVPRSTVTPIVAN